MQHLSKACKHESWICKALTDEAHITLSLTTSHLSSSVQQNGTADAKQKLGRMLVVGNASGCLIDED